MLTPPKSSANPVLSGTCEPHVILYNGQYFLFYADEGVGLHQSLHVATSTDGSTSRFIRIRFGPGDWDLSLANVAVWIEAGRWRMLYEARTRDDTWQIGEAEGSDPLTWAKLGGPLVGLRHSNGMYGGPSITRVKDVYHLWYHASLSGNLPTDIYHAWSLDGRTWQTDSPLPVLARTQSWEVDQVADPNVVEIGGRTFLFFDGDDNPGERAAIGLATFDGPLQDLVAGG